MTKALEENVEIESKPKKIGREEVRNLADEIRKQKELPPVIKRILDELLESDEIKSDEMNERLRGIHKQLNDIYSNAIEEKASAEKLNEIKKFRNRIEGLLGINPESERVDSSSLDRLKRDLEMAEISNKLRSGEKLSNEERRTAAGYLTRMYWGNVFVEGSESDSVVSFLFPGDDKLSIKNLNDKFLGPQSTDSIIKEKNERVRNKLKTSKTPDVSILLQNYKSDTAKIPESITTDDLESIASEIDVEMTAEIIKLLDARLLEEQDQEKKQEITTFKKHLEKNGFKITFSRSRVEGNSHADILYSVIKTAQGSRMARERKGHGIDYETDETLKEIGKIKSIREKLLKKNKVKNDFGKEFEIFSNVDGKYVLNRDIARDVRKGKFKTNDKEALGLIEEYLNKLNILDCVKPFTADELEETVGKIEKNRNLAGDVMNDNVERSGEIAEGLDREEKNENYTAKHLFHARSLKINNAAYISIDALDIGVDQILEFESLVQDLEKIGDEDQKNKEFKRISLEAGDQTTRKLQKFREIVNQVVREKNLSVDNEPTLGLIGGDEITLAFDMDKIPQEELDELMFEIKDRLRDNADGKGFIEIRSIKTVVSQARKEVGLDSTEEDKMEAHLAALKRAESGAELLKEIEKFVRHMNEFIEVKGEEEAKKILKKLPGLFYMENGKVKADFSIAEKDGKLMLLRREESVDYISFSYDEIDGIKDKLESAFAEKKKTKKAA